MFRSGFDTGSPGRTAADHRERATNRSVRPWPLTITSIRAEIFAWRSVTLIALSGRCCPRRLHSVDVADARKLLQTAREWRHEKSENISEMLYCRISPPARGFSTKGEVIGSHPLGEDGMLIVDV